jgi:Trk K+ transport system NAD-binding subunit
VTDRPEDGSEVTWWARLRYRANLLWDRGSWPVLVAVGGLTLVVVLASTAILVGTNSTFTTEHSRALAERFWQSLLRVIDPGTVASDVGWGPRLLSLMVTFSGILLFGTLIGTISATMQTRLATLRRGRAVVLETDHLVILGWSPWIDVLIEDLTLAGDQRRPSSIVVLADEDKAMMDDALQAAAGGRRGPRLICRHGDPTLASELARVNIRQAKTVVAVGSEAPTSDATVASTILAVGVACGGFSDRTVVAEVDDPAAAETLTRACAGEVEVLGDDVIADALAAWMVNPGTAGMLRGLLSLEDVKLALCELPEAYGRPFVSVVGAIQHASAIGIRRPDESFAFVPPPETVLRSGDRLVCLTNGSAPRWTGASDPAGVPGPAPVPPAPAPQRLMLIGWSRLAPGLLGELDLFVSAGSEVCVLCDSDLITEGEIALPVLQRLAVTVLRVPEPERELVSLLKDRPCSAIAVLAHQGLAPTDADAVTLATLMAVRQALAVNGGDDPHVVAELTDNKHAELAVVAGAHQTVARSGLLNDALAFAAVSPETRPILMALQKPGGPIVRLIRAGELGLAGEHSFATVAAQAYQHGLLAIGTRSHRDSSFAMRLHAERTEMLRLEPDDEVAALV